MILILSLSLSFFSPSSITKEVRTMRGVVDIHEVHVWQLVNGLTIGSMHVVIDSDADWTKVKFYLLKAF